MDKTLAAAVIGWISGVLQFIGIHIRCRCGYIADSKGESKIIP